MSGLSALLGLNKPQYKFNFHDDEALHDNTPEDKKWGSKDTIAALKMLGPAIQKGPEQAARGALPTLDVNDRLSQLLTKGLVSKLWGSMQHPPLTYLGDEMRYRTADGSYNNYFYPDLGKAGLPYAKTVQGHRSQHGAKPDPGDLFDLLMARPDDDPKESKTGISSMLLYHATLIIHDIFRTNDVDKNISDTSSYLDLTPLYGNCNEAQHAVRTHKLGMLKPDTFAEHRLLNQPPGVTCYLIMYNRFHNYVAKQLLDIDENSRFSLPKGSVWDKLSDADKEKARVRQDEDIFQTARLVTCGMYIQIAIHDYLRCLMAMHGKDTAWTLDPRTSYEETNNKRGMARGEGNMVSAEFNVLYRFHSPISERDAAWSKDLFEIWIGMTGRVKEDHEVTQEDIDTGRFLTKTMLKNGDIPVPFMRTVIDSENKKASEKMTWGHNAKQESFPAAFGGRWTRDQHGDIEYEGQYPKTKGRFTRNSEGKFDDAMLVEELTRSIEDPICQFGAQNIPKIFRSVEILGILQARKWELATLNEFRQFFGMSRHKHFEDINSDPEIQQRLRDMYEDPDMVELYPGLMCEGDGRCLDPGTACPGEESTALWRAVFSDAVTLVRSDRFYTIDWNVDSLTSWGFKELQSDPKINKGSVFHRLFQRAFPGFFEYNSVHMWQPFYTPAKNLALAEEQGYLNFLNLNNLEYKFDAKTWAPLNRTNESQPGYFKAYAAANYSQALSKRVRRSEATISVKQIPSISSYDEVQKILDDPKDKQGNLDWVNPGVAVTTDIPDGTLRKIITNTWTKWDDALKTFNECVNGVPDRELIFMNYFVEMSREIRIREQRALQKIKMGKSQTLEQAYQIDIIKDYTIPVITRFVVDFLGCWDQVKTNDSNLNRQYTENQIYQHIENCQNFQSWDSDETKVWQRRVAFRESMKFLKGFAEEGIAKSDATIYGIWSSAKRTWSADRANPDGKYVLKIREVAVSTIAALRHSGLSQEEVAAVMLSFALDIAHKIVLCFTETLAYFIDPKKHEDGKIGDKESDLQTQYWTTLKSLASKNTAEADKTIKEYIREANRLSYKLKICRKVNNPSGIVTKISTKQSDGSTKHEEKRLPYGTMVLLDVYTASQTTEHFGLSPSIFNHLHSESAYLTFGSSAAFTKKLSLVALAGLLKHTAQLSYLRVAHDKLGRLKRVTTPDGYMRYASAQWDRLLPFPSSWNLRFNGEGMGVHEGDNANQGHGLDQIWKPMEVKVPRARTLVEVAEQVKTVDEKVKDVEVRVVELEKKDNPRANGAVPATNGGLKTQYQPQVTTKEVRH